MADHGDAVRAFLSHPCAHFRPWRGPDGRAPQAEFLRALGTHRARVFRAGNRCGKSLALGWDVAAFCLGFHPGAGRRPPVHAWLVGLDREHGVGAILWPAVKRWLRPGDVRSVAWHRRGDPEIPETVTFTNGSTLGFKSADSGREKFQGASLDYVGLDEEMDRSIVSECRARLVDRAGALALTLTPVSRKVWVRELEREAGTLVVRASMRQAAAAGILDPAAVDAYLAGLGERERIVRDLGDFAALEGLVYPEFDRSVHVLRPVGAALVDGTGQVVAPWPLPDGWPRVAAMDFGYANPAAVVVAARRPDGTLIVPTVYYAAGVKIDTWAALLRAALPPLREAVTGLEHRLARPIVCDHDAGDRAVLAAAGLENAPAKKAVEAGIAAVSRRLVARTLRLVVHDDPRSAPQHPTVGRCDAHMLAWELEGYRYPETPPDRPSVRDQPLKKDDHATDAMRYLVMDADEGQGEWPFAAQPRTRTERYSVGLLDGVALPRPRGWE